MTGVALHAWSTRPLNGKRMPLLHLALRPQLICRAKMVRLQESAFVPVLPWVHADRRRSVQRPRQLCGT